MLLPLRCANQRARGSCDAQYGDEGNERHEKISQNTQAPHASLLNDLASADVHHGAVLFFLHSAALQQAPPSGQREPRWHCVVSQDVTSERFLMLPPRAHAARIGCCCSRHVVKPRRSCGGTRSSFRSRGDKPLPGMFLLCCRRWSHVFSAEDCQAHCLATC